MKEYLKPSMLVFSEENFSAKLQGSGATLVCSGTEYGMTLGATCGLYDMYNSYVQITLIEEGVTCPTNPSCVVTALTINGSTASTGMCHVEDYHQLDMGCGISVVCDSMYLCSSYGANAVNATVACSGFSEPVSCTTI